MGNTMSLKVLEAFEKKFGDAKGVHCFFAPGRVNLIGEHTDYNGGHVLPCALSIGTYAAVRVRDDRRLRFFSLNFEDEGIIEGSLDDLTYDSKKAFSNYPLAVVWALGQNGYEVPFGLDIAFFGDIPYCSGLSSSASVEVLTGFACRELFSFDLDLVSLARICMQAENEFVGVNCGIMDQFASAMGKRDYAIFLDTGTLDYEYIPVKFDGVSLVIACSNKKRGLSDSKYNERRRECEEALRYLREFKDINSLCELSEEEFDELCGFIPDPVCQIRARHAVLENIRTAKACEALKRNDTAEFGRLMNDSHLSLRDDYEVTGVELDTLVETAWTVPGVLGSRMTGAGFGGCTVSLVENNAVDSFIQTVGDVYLRKIGYRADFYVAETGDGPRELSEKI